MGDPSNCKSQKTTFQSLENCFWFPLPDTVESRQWAFQLLFQLPKAQLQWETLSTANLKKQLFRAWKIVFWFSPPDTVESRQWAFQVLFQLPKAQFAMGDPSNWKISKKNFSGSEKLFFDFTSQNPNPQSQKGSGKLCHLPTPGHMLEHAWSHKNRENSESWWNEARK